MCSGMTCGVSVCVCDQCGAMPAAPYQSILRARSHASLWSYQLIEKMPCHLLCVYHQSVCAAEQTFFNMIYLLFSIEWYILFTFASNPFVHWSGVRACRACACARSDLMVYPPRTPRNNRVVIIMKSYAIRMSLSFSTNICLAYFFKFNLYNK